MCVSACFSSSVVGPFCTCQQRSTSLTSLLYSPKAISHRRRAAAVARNTCAGRHGEHRIARSSPDERCLQQARPIFTMCEPHAHLRVIAWCPSAMRKIAVFKTLLVRCDATVAEQARRQNSRSRTSKVSVCCSLLQQGAHYAVAACCAALLAPAASPPPSMFFK